MNTKFALLLLVLSSFLAACGKPDAGGAAGTSRAEAEDGEHPAADAGHEDVAAGSTQGGEHAAGERGQGDVHGAEDAADPADARHVALTSQQVEAANIGLATAGPAEIRETLPLYGVVAPNAERVREVTARFPGVIRSVARSVGDSVQRGETLATVESNESLQTYAVMAPLSGVVIRRNANPGEHAGDQPLFTVADLRTVWVELSLFPRDLARVRVGQSVRVRHADTGRSADGKIIYVAPFGSSSNQTLTARVLLDNAQGHWPPGLYVTAEVTLAKISAPVAVSSGALQTLEQRTVVFVRDEAGFEPRAVQLGRGDGERVEVLAGLDSGETYATRNSFILKAELGKGEAGHGH